ncbi:MAG: stage III sporulation protein AF [Ruminococcus sp.]|nr:stage III sporulation protein AF [Ruminococcus sp.]
MSNFAALIGMVCVCAAVVSILSAISPNGITSKTLSLVIGVFIICVMLSPVKSFFTDFSLNLSVPEIPDSISSDAHDAYNEAVITETENRLEASLLSTLLNNGFSVSSVEIALGVNKDGGIYIEGINIYINKTEEHIPQIIRKTEEEYSITPKVIVKK